jgi:hypothetical protein
MTPFEFGYLVGCGNEKTAVSATSALVTGLAKAVGTAGKGLWHVDNASRGILRGFGRATHGAGQLIDATGEAARGVGMGAQSLGRHMLRPSPKGRIGILGDLAGLFGHTAHLGGNATKLTGHGASFVGNRLSDLGEGINYIGRNAPMGVPTLAAGGLLSTGANFVPKMPLPSVHFQSPINVNVDYETRRPVQFRW